MVYMPLYIPSLVQRIKTVSTIQYLNIQIGFKCREYLFGLHNGILPYCCPRAIEVVNDIDSVLLPNQPRNL